MAELDGDHPARRDWAIAIQFRNQYPESQSVIPVLNRSLRFARRNQLVFTP